MSDKKKFGLVMPKKVDASKIKKHSVFSDDESDEDNKSRKRPKIPQKKVDLKSKIKAETVEDPSIYEYDDIYDEMKLKQAESIAPKEKKQSRYIETLMKAAEKKKKEYERRMDKKIQAEREKEGDKYKDKEAFVTSSYKKKMLELEEEEEKERRENMLNDMMDVSKQKDLSGFYRHFLKQTVGEEKVPEFGEKDIKKEIVDEVDSSHELTGNFQDCKNQGRDGRETDSEEDDKLGDKKSNVEDKRKESFTSHSQFSKNLAGSSQDFTNVDQDSDGIEIDSDEDENLGKEKSITFDKRSKSYEKRSKNDEDLNVSDENSSDSESEKGEGKKQHIRAHHRKSSESSASNVSSSDDNESVDSIRKKKDKSKQKLSDKNIDKNATDNSPSHSSNNVDDINERIVDDDEKISSNEKSSKRNIYIKRTVGDIFAEAQAKYFQRMALRDART